MPENKKNEAVRNANNIKPQNQHYNIKKQALGPNGKRGN